MLVDDTCTVPERHIHSLVALLAPKLIPTLAGECDTSETSQSTSTLTDIHAEC